MTATIRKLDDGATGWYEGSRILGEAEDENPVVCMVKIGQQLAALGIGPDDRIEITVRND